MKLIASCRNDRSLIGNSFSYEMIAHMYMSLTALLCYMALCSATDQPVIGVLTVPIMSTGCITARESLKLEAKADIGPCHELATCLLTTTVP